jgi:hypothetical protein
MNFNLFLERLKYLFESKGFVMKITIKQLREIIKEEVRKKLSLKISNNHETIDLLRNFYKEIELFGKSLSKKMDVLAPTMSNVFNPPEEYEKLRSDSMACDHIYRIILTLVNGFIDDYTFLERFQDVKNTLMSIDNVPKHILDIFEHINNNVQLDKPKRKIKSI